MEYEYIDDYDEDYFVHHHIMQCDIITHIFYKKLLRMSYKFSEILPITFL